MPALVGTSGWSYKDWEGIVYPDGLPRAEQLPFFAQRLSTVEVNTTFYRTPPRKLVEGWIERTRDAPRFEFTVKGPKDLTQAAMAKASPQECARLAREWVDAVPRLLADAERLGAVFLQLSPGVLHDRPSLDRLERTLEALQEFPVAVELRNKTWLEPDRQRVQEDALQTLDAYDAALVAVDGPSWPTMLFEGHASHGYVRFHGRNADVWHRGRTVEKDEKDPRMNRYDYKYDPDELRPWAEAVRRESEKGKTLRVYFNNHPGGQGYHDARLFEGMLSRAALKAAPDPQRRLS